MSVCHTKSNSRVGKKEPRKLLNRQLWLMCIKIVGYDWTKSTSYAMLL